MSILSWCVQVLPITSFGCFIIRWRLNNTTIPFLSLSLSLNPLSLSYTHTHTHKHTDWLTDCSSLKVKCSQHTLSPIQWHALSTSLHHTANLSWDYSAWRTPTFTRTHSSINTQSFPPPSLSLAVQTHTHIPVVTDTHTESNQHGHFRFLNADDTVSISVETVLCSCGNMDSYGWHTPLASSMLPAT